MIAGYDDRLIVAHDGLLGVEQAHMFNRDRVRGMPRQIFGQVAIALIANFQIDGIELVVGLLPALTHQGEPFSREAKDIALVVKPDSLRFE